MNVKTKANSDSLPEIGGYFGLDIPDYGDLYPDSIKFQSGRAAMRAVLECNGIKRVMMPAYNCGSIHKAAVDAGVEVETYDLDESLYPKNLPPKLPDQCVVMYVNYFGLSLRNVARLHEAIPADRLIIDNSQALFASHTEALATIYSPRKFAGLPDGGLLMASTSLSITSPIEEDHGSFDRMKHLLVRMAYSAREGYGDFHSARDSIRDTSPLAMSRLTRCLMKSIQWNQVVERRRENYLIMAGMMNSINEMHWTLGENDAPLCYPLTLRGREINKVKKDLAEHNVFTATYWPDAAPRIKVGTIEETLLNETLFLPIDQRLERVQVEEVGRLVLKLTGIRRPC